MKHPSAYSYRFCASLLAAGALLQGSFSLCAQAEETVLNTFDDDTSTAGFWLWWGGIEREVSWDPTQDAGASAASGSVKLSFTFDNANTDNQYAVGMSLAGQSSYNTSLVANPTEYSALEFDLLWDTNSPITVDQFNSSGGDAGFNMGLALPDWSQSWISPSPTITGGGTWQHVVVPIEVTRPAFAGLIFKKWQPTGANGLNGPVTIWLDNFKLIKATAPPPVPTLNIQKSSSRGVQIFASASGQYQRQSIAATSEAAQALSWIGNAEPVTYSLTIAEAPANPNFQIHVFLSPDSGGANSPDWNDPNVIFLDIRRNADSTGQATFRYKTNAPNNNNMFYFQNGAPVDGRLAVLSTPTALGTWSLRFQNDTNLTLTGPDNTVTNFTMPPGAAELFRVTTSMTASFGIQPNQLELIGQSATFSEIKITSGSTTILDDTFQTADPDQQVDPTLWTRRMDDQKGITILGSDSAYVVSWGVPDTGYTLMSKPDLKAATWTELPLTATQIATTKRVLVSSTNLPSLTQGYFQLMQTNSPAPGN